MKWKCIRLLTVNLILGSMGGYIDNITGNYWGVVGGIMGAILLGWELTENA